MITTIVSERLAEEVEDSGIEGRLPDDTEIKRWSEFSPQSITADHLVLDLNFVHLVDGEAFEDLPLNSIFEGEQRNLVSVDQSRESLLKKFRELGRSDTIPNYLSSGCSLTVLYSDMLMVEADSSKIHTHYWLRELGLLARTKPVTEAALSDSGIEDYEVVSDSEPVQRYFDYVDGYTHILDFESGDFDEMVDENPPVLAESTEGNVIAARLSTFKHSSGEVQELEENLTLLPQPTRLQPRPQDLITSLAEIAIEQNSGEDVEPVTHGFLSGSSDLPELVSDDIEKELSKSRHGDEVIKQIEDGDACVMNDLLQPALGSYIHAVEWAFIAYLESKQGLDIIQKEQQGGTYYNLAGGHHSLLEEVQKHVDLDQKVVDSITTINQAERRWMAHHKSGRTLSYDALGLRSRLRTILEELFA
jgi:hypothetical protein